MRERPYPRSDHRQPYWIHGQAREGRASPPILFDPSLRKSAHRYLSGLGVPSPCLEFPDLAARLGVSSLKVKDESERLGLNSFKALGVYFAIEQLFQEGVLRPGSRLACATDGNHGRAVARCARVRKMRAEVYVHSLTSRARIRAIEGEGARVTVVSGNYDDAVKRVAEDAASKGWTLISDTAVACQEEIPRRIMAGYQQILNEALSQGALQPPPDVIVIQCGVGGLAAALIDWCHVELGPSRPFLVLCEPSRAACALGSLQQGREVALSGDLTTEMDCLSCGEVSSLAWPTLQCADACIAIQDVWARRAVEQLRHPVGTDPVLTTAPSGAAGLAGLLALLADHALIPVRRAAGLGPESRVFLVCTEGPNCR